MRRWVACWLVAAAILVLALPALADGPPRRYATKVADVFKPYTAEEWVVSPNEEPAGDQKVSNAPECDIKGVIACYDPDYLRVDLLLNQGVSLKWDVWYSVKMVYDNMNEYYTFYPYSSKFIYQSEKNGRLSAPVILAKDSTKDFAGVTNSGDTPNGDIYFILNKNEHIEGEKGRNYFLTCYFLSGYVNNQGEAKVADETIPVDLEFVY